MAKKQSSKERIQQLEKALQYIIDRAWVADNSKAGSWVREFVYVAEQAIRGEAI